jgi:OOP family OmpA-OmpF porin
LNRSFYFFFFIAFATANPSNAQENLVPNGSFEEHDTCPSGSTVWRNINYAIPWFAPSDGTPDYFHICHFPHDYIGVPDNFLGYQYPRTSDGYVGVVYTNLGSNNDLFEYISVELTSTLKRNAKYTLQFFVSLADSLDGILGNHLIAGSAIAPMGCLFTAERPNWKGNGYDISPFPASSESDSTILLTDSTGWQQVQMDYLAKGNEQYLTIGFFRTKSRMSYNRLINDGSITTYYYIDDVSLFEKRYSFPEKLSNLFTPNGDGMNDVFFIDTNLAEKIIIQVYNRWGNLVFESSDKTLWSGIGKNGKPNSEGVYYYLVSFINKEEEQKDYKGFIQLVR